MKYLESLSLLKHRKKEIPFFGRFRKVVYCSMLKLEIVDKNAEAQVLIDKEISVYYNASKHLQVGEKECWMKHKTEY